MAVAISQTAAPAGLAAASNVATYTSVSIGAAASDRIIAVLVGTELASSTPSACTIGGVAANVGTLGSFGAVYARVFWLPVAAGTTATITVTYSATNPLGSQNRIAVYRIVGAGLASPTTGGNGSTDMDATVPLTTGSNTIPTGGGFLAIAACGTDTVAKTWANATEDLDVDAGNFRFTTAFTTTAGTATRTVTGATNGEDGALAWINFTEAVLPTVSLNSPSDAAAITDATPEFSFTGTDAEGDDIRYQVQIANTLGFGWLDSYSEANQNAVFVYGNTSSSASFFGQSFTGDGAVLLSATFYIAKRSGITGNLTAKIYAHSGTFGTNGIPTGAVLATSDVYDSSTLATSLQLTDFTFSGVNQITLVNGTKYVVVIDCESTSSSIAIDVGVDTSSPTHNGNFVDDDGGWNGYAGIDAPFYVNRSGSVLSKISGTDPGFTGTPDSTDPFTSGQPVTFTVQAGDALPDGTYYWRVRAIDPLGSNSYGAWSSTRSFTLSTASGFTLVADQASFTLAGFAAGLLRGLNLTATQTTFTLTGIATALAKAYRLDITAVTFTATGIDATFARNYQLPCTTATFTATDVAAGVLFNRAVIADQATFTLSGIDAALSLTQTLDITTATFTATGVAATFTRTYVLSADPATFALTGTAPTLLRAYVLPADQASYTLAAFAVAFPRANVLLASTGIFTMNSQDAAFLRAIRLTADTATFTFATTDTTLAYHRLLEASVGSYAVLTVEATFARSYVIVGGLGAFTATGQDAVVVKNFAIAAETGTFTLSGVVATVSRGVVMAADGAIFTLTGVAANFQRAYVFPANATPFTLTGQANIFQRQYVVPVTAGIFTLSGQAALFQRSIQLTAETQSFALSGNAVDLTAAYVLTAISAGFVLDMRDAAVEATGSLDAGTGTFTLTGGDAVVTKQFHLAASPASFALAGTAATVQLVFILDAIKTTYAFATSPVTFQKQARIEAEPASFVSADTTATFIIQRNYLALLAAFTLEGYDIETVYGRSLQVSAGNFILSPYAIEFSRMYADIEDPYCDRVSLNSRMASPYTERTAVTTARTTPYSDRTPVTTRPPKQC